jgi:sugar phosphate permease
VSTGIEGRVRRWRWAIWGVFSAIYFLSHFHRVAPAVVAADLMAAFRTTGAQLGALSAIYPYVFAVMGLPAGALADTLGPRRTVALGATTMGVGAVVFALAPRFGVAFMGRLLVGLGASVILIAFLRLCTEWFRPDEFATLSGLTQTVGNVGALVAAGPLAFAVERLGWRGSFLLIGAATVGLAASWWGVVRDRPEERGLPPVNTAARAGAPVGLAVLQAIPRVLGNPQSWPAVLAMTGVYGTLLAFLGLWAVPYLTQVYRLSRVEATAFTGAVALGIIVGSPLVGWISDRWLARRRLPFAAFGLVYVACWAGLALPAPGSLPLQALFPLCLALGFASSAVVLVFACVREVNDPAHTGVAIGLPNAIGFLGIGLLQWRLGALLDARWDGLLVAGVRVYGGDAYRAAFGVCLAIAVLALVAACLIPETRGRNVWAPPRQEATGIRT